MKNIEFNKSLRELNGRYKEIFGYIPCIKDYACTREKYVEALDKAIKLEKELMYFVMIREQRSV